MKGLLPLLAVLLTVAWGEQLTARTWDATLVWPATVTEVDRGAAPVKVGDECTFTGRFEMDVEGTAITRWLVVGDCDRQHVFSLSNYTLPPGVPPPSCHVAMARPAGDQRYHYDLFCHLDADVYGVINTSGELAVMDGVHWKVGSASHRERLFARGLTGEPATTSEWAWASARVGAIAVWLTLPLWPLIAALWRRRRLRAAAASRAAAQLRSKHEGLAQLCVREGASILLASGRIGRMSETVQLDVTPEAEAPGDAYVPMASWPSGVPLRVPARSKVRLVGARLPGARVAWIAGCRTGGQARDDAPREMAARFEPVGKEYVVSAWAIRYEDLGGNESGAPPLAVEWGILGNWLGWLAWGAGWLSMLVPLVPGGVFLGLVTLISPVVWVILRRAPDRKPEPERMT